MSSEEEFLEVGFNPAVWSSICWIEVIIERSV